jgi:hypothetical protein
MAINTIVINSVNQPQVSQYTTRIEYLGGSTILASGDLRRDLVDSNGKRRWTLTWASLDSTDLGKVITAHSSAVAADVGFTSPDGTGYTVNAGPNPSMQWEAYKVPGGVLRYRVTMELFEV